FSRLCPTGPQMGSVGAHSAHRCRAVIGFGCASWREKAVTLGGRLQSSGARGSENNLHVQLNRSWVAGCAERPEARIVNVQCRVSKTMPVEQVDEVRPNRHAPVFSEWESLVYSEVFG